MNIEHDKYATWMAGFAQGGRRLNEALLESWEADKEIQRQRSLGKNLAYSVHFLNLDTGTLETLHKSGCNGLQGFVSLADNLTAETILAATPEDYRSNVMKKEARYLDYLLHVPDEYMHSAMVCYYRPLMNKDLTPFCFQIQMTVEKCDLNGRPWIVKLKSRLLSGVDIREEHAEKVLTPRNSRYKSLPYQAWERPLTRDKLTILKHLNLGYKPEEIALILMIAESTVTTHRQSILVISGAHTIHKAFEMYHF